MSSKKDFKIAGVVILYHPDKSFRENIDSYIEDIDILYVIDNSETPSPAIKEQLPKNKSVYIPYHDNLGVAKALNDAAELAIQHECDFLLTMDQDSKAMPGMIPHMLQCLTRDNIETIGIVSPHHLMSHLKDTATAEKTCKDVLTTMTSGNLLNLTAFQQTGHFTDKLFIDAVDFDYCLRLHQKGFRIIEAVDSKLMHQLGNVVEHNFFGRSIYVCHYPAARRYYITRNYLYIINKFKLQYPAFCRSLAHNIFLTTIHIILFERDKLKKLRMMVSGVIDYKKGFYGRYT